MVETFCEPVTRVLLFFSAKESSDNLQDDASSLDYESGMQGHAIVAVILLCVYLWTLSPSVAGGDSGITV